MDRLIKEILIRITMIMKIPPRTPLGRTMKTIQPMQVVIQPGIVINRTYQTPTVDIKTQNSWYISMKKSKETMKMTEEE